MMDVHYCAWIIGDCKGGVLKVSSVLQEGWLWQQKAANMACGSKFGLQDA
ncbi:MULTISPECIES: hypothetical protein [Vitreoscilla]|uniref:Uncharacterized protein n=1 Tax=Vitreoscilla stercoraria TaxID=61 RepID=A0ABY4EBJ3_VITST|nr:MULTISPECIES: hypothetical protein [Vitreoscilla]UOO93116.1 hypothetical protein LVJ81_03540 [Vitreoscilla stercoraria]